MNSGGVIQVADELHGFSFERAQQRASGIFETTRRVFELARTDGVPPAIAADRLAERRIRDVGRLRGIYLRADAVEREGRGRSERASKPRRACEITGEGSVAPGLGVVGPLVEVGTVVLLLGVRLVAVQLLAPTPRSPSRECGTSGRGRPSSASPWLGRAP